jgi:hypothetical protein
MALWPTTLRVTHQELKLLVTTPEEDDLLKARLPIRPRHPGALLTLLEGLALWSGEPLYVVISAGKHREDWLGSEQWGEELWPEESALVQFDRVQFRCVIAKTREILGVSGYQRAQEEASGEIFPAHFDLPPSRRPRTSMISIRQRNCTQFDLAAPRTRRRRTLSGVGDFRGVRQQGLLAGRSK